MTKTEALLAIGRFRKAERVHLDTLAGEASLHLEVAEGAAEAAEWLAEQTPRALLVNSSEDTESICVGARSQARQALTPIISLNRELDDLSFAEVFSWGGDDVVSLQAMRPLLSRVRALPDHVRGTSTDRGTAVVADSNRSRRVVRARVLRNAGYELQFAVSTDDATRYVREHQPALIVFDSELEGAWDGFVASATKHPQTMHILLCAPRRLAQFSRALRHLANAAAADGFAPPENVVFLANELTRGGANDQRSSRRLLYGTKVAFRGAGRESDDWGFVYNISEGGLYIRTLAPPQDDTVWVELRPPRTDRQVRVEGQVVWRRGYGPADCATVPPGFGVKLTDGCKSDLEAWLKGYNEFFLSLGHSPNSIPAAQPPKLP